MVIYVSYLSIPLSVNAVKDTSRPTTDVPTDVPASIDYTDVACRGRNCTEYQHQISASGHITITILISTGKLINKKIQFSLFSIP